MGGKPPEEFLGTPSKSVIYHPRNMSGKFGAIGRHVTISRLRALTIGNGLVTVQSPSTNKKNHDSFIPR